MNLTIPILFVIFIVLINLGIYFLGKKGKWKLNPKLSKLLKHIHYLCLAFFLVLLILNLCFDIRPKGQSTTKVIFILTSITAILFYAIGLLIKSKKIERAYFSLWVLIPIISICLFLITSFRFTKVIDRIFNPISYIFFENSDYRIQNTDDGLFQPKRVEAFKKKLFYDQKIRASYLEQIYFDKIYKSDPYLIFYDRHGDETKRIKLKKN